MANLIRWQLSPFLSFYSVLIKVFWIFDFVITRFQAYYFFYFLLFFVLIFPAVSVIKKKKKPPKYLYADFKKNTCINKLKCFCYLIYQYKQEPTSVQILLLFVEQKNYCYSILYCQKLTYFRPERCFKLANFLANTVNSISY